MVLKQVVNFKLLYALLLVIILYIQPWPAPPCAISLSRQHIIACYMFSLYSESIVLSCVLTTGCLRAKKFNHIPRQTGAEKRWRELTDPHSLEGLHYYIYTFKIQLYKMCVPSPHKLLIQRRIFYARYEVLTAVRWICKSYSTRSRVDWYMVTDVS